jgi:alkanesulfonate monooxygenase SsuD/methylene tetrahydromethanopterin reductase-like flavin-dependent oxidoreductase (luciferase family)
MTIQFGVFLPSYNVERLYETNVEITLAAERMGLDSVFICDHLTGSSSVAFADTEPRTEDILEAWTTLSSLATQTHRVRLGTLVSCIGFRNPAVLAKMGATFDAISRGRLILGLGAGWRKAEYQMYGLTWEPFEVRLNRLREAVTIVRRLWEEPAVDFEGKFYRLKRCELWPKPLQKPHPPLWFGGGPRDKSFALVTEFDGWAPASLAVSEFEERRPSLVSISNERGRPIEVATELYTSIAETSDQASRQCSDYVRTFFGCSLKDIEEGKGMIRNSKIGMVVGNSEQCLDQIGGFVQAGVTHFILHFMPLTKEAYMNGLELYSKKIIPHFR